MKYILPIIIFAVSFAYDPRAYHAYHAPKNYLFLLLTIFSLILWAYYFYKNNSKYIYISLLEMLVLIRIIWIIVGNPDLLLKPNYLGFWIILSLLLVAFLARQLVNHTNNILNNKKARTTLQFFFRAIWMIGTLQAIIGLGQFYVYKDYTFVEIKTPIIGTIGSANGYGLILTLSLLALSHDILRQKKILSRILLSVSGLIIILALILNGSRGAIFSLLLTSIFWISIYLYHQQFFSIISKKIKIIIVILLMSGIISFTYFLYQINPESSSGRFLIWRISAPMLYDNLFSGVGHGNVAVEYLNYQAKFFRNSNHQNLAYKAANLKQIHNEYLQAFCEGGIIGGVLFLAIWFIAVYKILRYLKTVGGKDRLDYYIIGALFVAVLLHSLVDTPMHVLPVLVITYILIGFIPLEKPVWMLKVNSKYFKLGLALFLTTYFIFILQKSIKEYPAYIDWKKGVDNAKLYNWDPAIRYYKKALEDLPNMGELLFHTGSAMVFSGAYSKGIYNLNKSLESFNDSNIYLSLSYAYLKLKNYTEAEKFARIAFDMFPDQLASLELLGEIYFYQGNFKLSKESLEKCIKQKTKIKSESVKQISDESKKLWERFYGKYESLSD